MKKTVVQKNKKRRNKKRIRYAINNFQRQIRDFQKKMLAG